MVIENLLQAETLPSLPPKQDYQHKYLLPLTLVNLPHDRMVNENCYEQRHYQTYPQNRTITDTTKPTPKTRLSQTLANLPPKQDYQHKYLVQQTLLNLLPQ